MSDAELQPEEGDLESLQQEEENGSNNAYSQIKGSENQWYSDNLVLDKEHSLDESDREEIRSALLAGQKTITLSADDASLEAKIAEIIRQSRMGEQGGNGSQQQFIEIVNDDQGNIASRLFGSAVENDSEGDKVVEIDLMNFKLIRYQEDGTEQEVNAEDEEVDLRNVVIAEHTADGQQQYIQISNGIDDEIEQEESMDGHVDCIVEDTSEQDSQESKGLQPGVQYVQVVERDSVPLVFFTAQQPKPQPTLSQTGPIRPGRRKRGEFVLPPGAMDSPNFKLFLYNCKLCDFKCNAIKELTAHKATHPGVGAGRYRNLAKPPIIEVQPEINSETTQFVEHCDLCPYKATSKLQMNRHITKYHALTKSKTTDGSPLQPIKPYHSYEAHTPESSVTFYCCKTCSYKTDNRAHFKRHKCRAAALGPEHFILP